MNEKEEIAITSPGSFAEFSASRPEQERGTLLAEYSTQLNNYRKHIVAGLAGSTALNPLLDSIGRNV